MSSLSDLGENTEPIPANIKTVTLPVQHNNTPAAAPDTLSSLSLPAPRPVSTPSTTFSTTPSTHTSTASTHAPAPAHTSTSTSTSSSSSSSSSVGHKSADQMRADLITQLQSKLPSTSPMTVHKGCVPASVSASSTDTSSFNCRQMSNILCQVVNKQDSSQLFSVHWTPFQQTFAPTVIVEGLTVFNSLTLAERTQIIQCCLEAVHDECTSGQWKFKGFFIKGTNATRGISSKSIPFINSRTCTPAEQAQEQVTLTASEKAQLQATELHRCAALIVTELETSFTQDKQHGFILQPFLFCLQREFRLFFHR